MNKKEEVIQYSKKYFIEFWFSYKKSQIFFIRLLIYSTENVIIIHFRVSFMIVRGITDLDQTRESFAILDCVHIRG